MPIYTKEKDNQIYKLSHFIQSIRSLCDLGFLAEYRHLSDDALMLEILCMRLDWDLDNPETLFLERSYREILELDTQRILCCYSIAEWKTRLNWEEALNEEILLDYDWEEISDEDLEDRQKHSFHTLLKSLGKLSKISRGKFVPKNIIKVDTNCIKFDLEGHDRHLTLNALPYEPAILAGQVNPIILDTGYQFEIFSAEPYGLELYVILLSEQEKQDLANRTKILFDDVSIFPSLPISSGFLYGEPPPDYSFEIVLDTLGQLSRISRGQFIPQNIVEIDKNLIQFDLNGKSCCLVTAGPPDDPWILAGQLNPIIADTGYQFESCSDDYPDEFIILLSEKEKKKIIQNRGLTFWNCWQHYKWWRQD